ncbi:MAG: hypothetical protein IPL39_14870 [Opitutaceae bacterium]|nr:hypothetical protein [Opitutaceae bacterium]
MKTPLSLSGFALLLCLAGSCATASAQAYLTAAPYLQDFDSLGTAGTTAPIGWQVYSMAGGHDTFAPVDSSTPGAAPNMAAGALTSRTPLIAGAAGTQRSNQGYNFATTAASTDRSLGSSPTGIAAEILELSLVNGSGLALAAINLSYDIRRFTEAGNTNGYNASPYYGKEENPGYNVFYSLDNSVWTRVAALTPSLAGSSGVIVPDTVGVTNVGATLVELGASWNAGSTLRLRWLDDNAQSSSPDQLLGLDNVQVAIPEPSTYAAVFGAAALGLAGIHRLRRRAP